MLLVVVDMERLTVGKQATLIISVEQKVPVCQECDSGCWKFKRWQRVSKSIRLAQAGKRTIVDIGEMVPTWELMGIRVKAAILDGKRVIEESTFNKEGWAWCA
jgi:hypothetical protein